MAYNETTASVMRENDKMLAALKHIAAIAHSGGLAGLDEFDAMCAVRRLTLKYWDNKQTEDEERLSAVDAVRASYCAIGHNANVTGLAPGKD